MTTRELLSQNSGELTRKLQSHYHIGQSQVYKRLGALNIKSQKDKTSGEVWLTSEQLQLFDALHNHLNQGFPMETFIHSSDTALVVHQSHTIDNTPPQSTLDSQSIPETPIETIHAKQAFANSQAIAALQRVAQEKAAGNLILTNLLAAQYQNHPELLDSDLQQAIAQSEAAATPKSIDPNLYAQKMLSRLTPSSTT